MDRALDLLIVDDDVGHVELFQVLIRELGLRHRCHHASSGTLALDYLKARSPFEGASRPNLILLDLNMPGLNGCEVLRIIKSDPGLRTIPVIVLSQSRNWSDVNQCYGDRANAYIGKPDDLDSNLRLLQQIDRFWGQIATLPDDGR